MFAALTANDFVSRPRSSRGSVLGDVNSCHAFLIRFVAVAAAVSSVIARCSIARDLHIKPRRMVLSANVFCATRSDFTCLD